MPERTIPTSSFLLKTHPLNSETSRIRLEDDMISKSDDDPDLQDWIRIVEFCEKRKALGIPLKPVGLDEVIPEMERIIASDMKQSWNKILNEAQKIQKMLTDGHIYNEPENFFCGSCSTNFPEQHIVQKQWCYECAIAVAEFRLNTPS